MSDAPDSPRPWRVTVLGKTSAPIFDAAGNYVGMMNADAASLTLRAVNNYEKMREALNKIASQKRTDELETACDVEYADFEQGYDDSIAVARAILKEIDNG